MKIILNTQAGNRYIVDGETGNISRTDIAGFQPSGQWRFLGLDHVKRREFVQRCNVPGTLERLSLRYKNGKPQYTVRDFYHGTIRNWVDGVIRIEVQQ